MCFSVCEVCAFLLLLYTFRLKFEDDSSDSEKSSISAFPMMPQQDFFDGDPELPLISRSESGYPVHSIIQTLLASDVDESRVCKVQPLGVMRNAVFMIDLDEVHFSDLKADDLGSWKATGTKRTHFRFTRSQDIRYASRKPHGSMAGNYFLLTRRYYVHRTYDRFHRIIADIKGEWLVLSLLCTCENVVVGVFF